MGIRGSAVGRIKMKEGKRCYIDNDAYAVLRERRFVLGSIHIGDIASHMIKFAAAEMKRQKIFYSHCNLNSYKNDCGDEDDTDEEQPLNEM